MKNHRIVFILLLTCSFTMFLTAQTSNLQQTTNEICIQKFTITSAKSITLQTPPKKSLVVTKKRRLKSYRSNYKIAQKRKTVIAENVIAINE